MGSLRQTGDGRLHVAEDSLPVQSMTPFGVPVSSGSINDGGQFVLTDVFSYPIQSLFPRGVGSTSNSFQ